MRRFGVAAVLFYLAGIALALRVGPVDVRPLYDGVHVSRYAWINPPSGFATGNTLPQSGELTAAAADPVTLTTDDTQASLDFRPDGFASGGSLHATITPVDPATLGSVGPNETAVGNAYRIELTIDGANIVTLAKPKTLRLRQPTSGGRTIYQSPDGHAWQELASSLVAGHVLASTTQLGYYVLAGPTGFVPPLSAPRAARADRGSRNLIIVIVGSLIILLAVVWGTLRRRPHRRTTGFISAG